MKKYIVLPILLCSAIACSMEKMLNMEKVLQHDLGSVANNSTYLLQGLENKSVTIDKDPTQLDSIKARFIHNKGLLCLYKAGIAFNENQKKSRKSEGLEKLVTDLLMKELEEAAQWTQKQNFVNVLTITENNLKLKNFIRPYTCKNCKETVFEKGINKFPRCSACKKVYYCSIDCQKAHRAKHTPKCLPITTNQN